MNKFICHSGGCPGSDMEWENEGSKYGIKTIAYSFHNHKHEGSHPKILTVEELQEGYVMCRKANQTLKRNFDGIIYPYVKNLLARNWFQVKNSEAVFAIAKGFLTKETVDGGTGWAVQMAVDCDKPVYVFYQDAMGGGWYRYKPVTGFELCSEPPLLTENFAGIGTREINEWGKLAIRNILKKTMDEWLKTNHGK